jgi:hypothetical protein
MKKRLRRKLVPRMSAAATAPNEVASLRVLSELVGGVGSRVDLARYAGKSFHGKRDLYDALGYDRSLVVEKYRDRYERNGVAKRIVEAAPRATWRGGVEVVEDEDPEISTPFEEAFVKLDKRLHVWATLCRVDILAGIGRYAGILIGAPGTMDTPLPDSLTPEKIVYLQPYGEDDLPIQTWDADPASTRFGLPTTYQLNRTDPSGTRKTVSSNVHYTRILHVACDVLDETVYGQPRLKCVWNDLDNLEKILGGGSEAFWQRVNKGLVFNLDKELSLDTSTDEGKKKVDSLKRQFEEYEHKLKRILTVQGMNVQELGGDVANFANQVDSLLTIMAASTGMPKRILQGSERGELSSIQDATNWDTQIEDRRDQFAMPYVLYPLVELFIKIGVLPTPKEWDVKWPSLVQMDEQGKADLALKYQKLGQEIITNAEIRNDVLGKQPLSDQQKAEIAASAPPVPGAPGGPVDETQVGVVVPGTKRNGPVPVVDHTRTPPGGVGATVPVVDHNRSKPTPRAAAARFTLPQLRAESVAKKRAPSLAGKILDAIRRARRALSPKLLSYAVGTGAQTMVEHEVSKAFGELERSVGPELQKDLHATLLDGADMAARSIHLHGVPLRARAAGGPGSGYFGHAGVPGVQGGSSTEGTKTDVPHRIHVCLVCGRHDDLGISATGLPNISHGLDHPGNEKCIAEYKAHYKSNATMAEWGKVPKES